MGFIIEDIVNNTNGELLNSLVNRGEVEHFVFDTRNLYFVHDTLFLAFKGRSTDGHNYIRDAYDKGIRHFLVSKAMDISDFPNANFIYVNDTIEAIHLLSIWHRNKFVFPIVGITGSTGKTSIKEWIYQLLIPEKKVVKNPRSFNSTIGVPLSILSIRPWHQIGIFEAGPAAPNDMDDLVDMIIPDVGIFTNIGDAHSANFKNKQEKIKEKLKLFKNVDKIIYSLDHEEIDKEVKKLGIPSFTWSYGTRQADVSIVKKDLYKEGFKILISSTIQLEKKVFEVYLPYRDKAALENVMHCITYLLFIEFPLEKIIAKIPFLSKLNMRMEMKEGVKNCTILDDSYSADLDSFIIAMDYLERQSTKEKKTLVITDFVDSENSKKDLYARIAAYINGSSVNRVVGIGEEIKELSRWLNHDILFISYPSVRYVIADLWKELIFEDEVILVKGARSFSLDKLTERLYERTHNTVLEVDMYGLAKNLKVYSELLSIDTKIMAMVKASAYGAGAVEVAKMLEYNNIDYLAVAYADEGVKLRQHGITTPIMVLNPEIPQFDFYLRYKLEPEIYSLKMLRKLSDYIKYRGVMMSIHLKIESGMNRLGFVEENLEEVIEILQENQLIHISSIFSHLSSSGEADKDKFSHAQITRYLASYKIITEAIGIQPMKHILNSAGIIRFPEYHFDMVRLGAGLYGIDSYLPFKEKITTVLTFKSRISQLKIVKKGDSVGYSRGYLAPRDMTIAIVSAGYADGIPRSVSNGKYDLLVNGMRATILGSVAMDMCMVDVTHISNVSEEDEVVIFGKEHPVNDLAKAADTISYEIFTRISDRVKRIYCY